MEKVTKVCLQLIVSEVFLSLFPHTKGICYRLSQLPPPKGGGL